MKCPSCQQSIVAGEEHVCAKQNFPVPEDFLEDEPLPYYAMKELLVGRFMMGSPLEEEGRDPDEDLHEVILNRAFAVGCTEVPQELYVAIMGDNPSSFLGARRPVDSVSWIEACIFCNEYSLRMGKSPVYEFERQKVYWKQEENGFRLPTEAEWEYAARKALQETPLTEQAWFADNSEFETKNVGRAGGVADMAGNVWEWVWDWYAPYPTTPTVNPIGPSRGTVRSVRGGCYADSARVIRPANRAYAPPDHKSNTIGFRVLHSLG